MLAGFLFVRLPHRPGALYRAPSSTWSRLNPLTAARAQMEVSLGFHMVFAALGIGLPVLLLIAEWLWLRTGQPHYRALARQ